MKFHTKFKKPHKAPTPYMFFIYFSKYKHSVCCCHSTLGDAFIFYLFQLLQLLAARCSLSSCGTAHSTLPAK